MSNTFPRRFYLERNIDQTGVSGTGKVLHGVILPSGRVMSEWRAPLASLGIYQSLAEFRKIHVESHPNCGKVVVYDRRTNWHCFGCGAGGLDGNFCCQCGCPSTAYYKENARDSERIHAEHRLEHLAKLTLEALTPEQRTEHRALVDALRTIED